MKTRRLLACCVGLALLGTGCASTPRPPGVDGTEYRDWRVMEFRRGHLRPADADEQLRLAYFAANRFNGLCSGSASYVPGSFCNPRPTLGPSQDVAGNNGRTRTVEDPTGNLNRGVERAY